MSRRSQIVTLIAIVLLIAGIAGCAPQASLFAPPPTATPAPFPGLNEWNVVFLTSSMDAGVGQQYARLIETDQRVKVRLHDCWLQQGESLTVAGYLDMLRLNADTGCDGKWQDLVRDAEVIVVSADPFRSMPADGAWDTPDSWLGCLTGAYVGKDADPDLFAVYRANMARSCTPQTFERYKADLGALYDEIAKVRGGRPIIMRATDFYVPFYADWQKGEVKDVCGFCVDNLAAAARQVAAEHRVPVASSMDALNGLKRNVDPRARDWTDGPRLTEAGAQRVAVALQQTGYGYSGK